jgi:hypothetical protein
MHNPMPRRFPSKQVLWELSSWISSTNRIYNFHKITAIVIKFHHNIEQLKFPLVTQSCFVFVFCTIDILFKRVIWVNSLLISRNSSSFNL